MIVELIGGYEKKVDVCNCISSDLPEGDSRLLGGNDMVLMRFNSEVLFWSYAL